MHKKTLGQLESEISSAIIKFEKDHLGRGPNEIKTYILDDMIFVRLLGVLTPAEEKLSKTAEGANLIKKVRISLMENSRKLLENIVFDITKCKLLSLHTDISTKRGERVIIFTIEKKKKFCKL